MIRALLSFSWRLHHSCWQCPDALMQSCPHVYHSSLSVCSSVCLLHLNSSNNPCRAVLCHFALTIRNAVFYFILYGGGRVSWLAERHHLVIPSIRLLKHLQVLVMCAWDLIKGSGQSGLIQQENDIGGRTNTPPNPPHPYPYPSLSLPYFPIIQSIPPTFSSSYYQHICYC